MVHLHVTNMEDGWTAPELPRQDTQPFGQACCFCFFVFLFYKRFSEISDAEKDTCYNKKTGCTGY